MLEFYEHAAPAHCVLVHGAGGNNLLWKRTVQYLAGESQATAVNLPGHPSGEITCKTVDEYSEALHAFLAEREGPAPILCGHSMGSAIALTLAIQHPEDIAGLILVGSGAKMGVDSAILQGLRTQTLKAIEQIITPRSFYSVDLGLGREARGALSVSNLPVFLNDYLACQGFDVRAQLPRIVRKTLIVCGDKDAMAPPKWSHYLHENIENSELFFVRDSGHMLPLEKPETLGSLVQAFLSSFSP